MKESPHATAEPSSAHVKVPGSLSTTVTPVVWSAALPGANVIAAVGAAVSTVKAAVAGADTLPITSLATIATVCGPSARPAGSNGEVQGCSAPPSVPHAYVAAGSSDVNSTCGVRVGDTGGVTETAGGVRSSGRRSRPSASVSVVDAVQTDPRCSHRPPPAAGGEHISHEAAVSGARKTT